MKSIEMCVSRFDSETKATFLDLYTKVDAEPVTEYEDETKGTEYYNPESEGYMKPIDTFKTTQSDDYSDPDNSEDIF